ncbi:unnamed protein product [Protopolystoma xenopodis]|uniref:Protein kinase domain-containing protein n=1 Tax=Protopolystoma xenopodis TaxID=117903 RepID=A0A448XAG3_9PLAT|nr:unnamed protein product [Protopolystoma xenopodis]
MRRRRPFGESLIRLFNCLSRQSRNLEAGDRLSLGSSKPKILKSGAINRDSANFDSSTGRPVTRQLPVFNNLRAYTSFFRTNSGIAEFLDPTDSTYLSDRIAPLLTYTLSDQTAREAQVQALGLLHAESSMDLSSKGSNTHSLQAVLTNCQVSVAEIGTTTAFHDSFSNFSRNYRLPTFLDDFPRNRLQLGVKLGEGAFGIVYKGLATDLPQRLGRSECAVKTLRCKPFSAASIT